MKIPIIGNKKKETGLTFSISVTISRDRIEGFGRKIILRELLKEMQGISAKVYNIALEKKAKWEAETKEEKGKSASKDNTSH